MPLDSTLIGIVSCVSYALIYTGWVVLAGGGESGEGVRGHREISGGLQVGG